MPTIYSSMIFLNTPYRIVSHIVSLKLTMPSAGGNGTAEKNALGWSDRAEMKRGPRVRLRTWGVGATGEWCGP